MTFPISLFLATDQVHLSAIEIFNTVLTANLNYRFVFPARIGQIL